MELVDVVFPLNLGPLTYKVPGSLKEAVRPGSMVEAEVRRSVTRGIVLGTGGRHKGPLKSLTRTVGEGPAFNPAMLSLIRWMTDYYFATEGMVLKTIMPREFFEKTTPRGQGPASSEEHLFSPETLGDAAREGVREIRDHALKKSYATFLLEAPSMRYELSFLLETLKGLRNVLILLPDYAEIELLSGALAQDIGEERLALYHAGLSRGKRSREIDRIISGEADVVLGSRNAVFAPLRDVSLIAVLQEESIAYKEEGGVRYNARDVAVMRGYREGAAVLLSSICPSAESYHNAALGKYTLLSPPPRHLRPKVRVIDARKSTGTISRPLRQAVEARMYKGEKVLLYVNRKGFSMLQCGDCEHLEACPECNIPMVFYKGRRVIHCGYCGKENRPPDVCPVCQSHELKTVGSGMEKVEEELRELRPIGVDKKRKNIIEVISEGGGGLAVGTKVLTRSPRLSGAFSLAGVVNADGHLYIPDFRASERAFQDLMYAAERVRPGGQLIVQSRNPGARIFSHLRNFSTGRFFRDELKEREELRYPPFSKMALITLRGKEEPKLAQLPGQNVEVLGPVYALGKGGRRVWKLIIKAPSRTELRPAVDTMLRSLRDRKVILDVDPLSI
jgi:primosomal protein N' (replication factor Y)